MAYRSRFAALAIGITIIATACSPTSETEPTATAPTTPASTSAVNPPTATPQAPPPTPPPIVPLLRTTGGGDLVFGQQVAVTSQVLSAEPIGRLELWVDGTRVADHDFAEPQTNPTFPWQWTSDSVGLHAMELRAFDTSGQAAASSPSWLQVSPGWNPETGQPLDGLPESQLGTASAGVTVDPAKCTATLAVAAAPGSLGQTVVGTTLGLGRSVAIGVVGPAGGDITVPMTAAPVMVSIASFDDNISTLEPPRFVPGAAECAPGSWAGEVSFNGTVLENGAGLDAAYLYATKDDLNWHRLPETGFAPATAAGFNFADLPLPVSGGHVEVEVWGWAGGELITLGRGRYEIATAVDPLWGHTQPVAPYSSLNVVRNDFDVSVGVNEERLLTATVLCTDGAFHSDCDPAPHALRWNTQLLGAEAGLIQVSSAHPPNGPSTDFPGLLWSTMIAMDGERERDFELALDQIRNGTAPSGESRSGAGQPGWFDYSDLEAMGAELSVVDQPAPPGASPRMSAPAQGSWWQGIPPARLWVRVIPFTNSQPTDGTSNVVLYEVDSDKLVIEPPADQVFDALYDVQVEFNQPLQMNEAFSHCVRVIENPYGSNNPAPVPQLQFAYDGTRSSARVFTDQGVEHEGLVPGATVCAFKPDPPDKDFFDYVGEAISFVGQAWDTFKDLVDMVKGGIIKGIVDITGCEPEATCVAALTALADAGLAAVGVPPTMPSFSELMETAKGDIAASLTKALVGQVCDGPCADFAAKFVEDALDDIETHFSELATTQAQSGGWVLYLNPDIRVVPEPSGQLFPGSIEARITRKADGLLVGSVAPESCSVSLRTEGAGPLTWTTKRGDTHLDEAVNGPVFALASVTVDLTRLGPGESVTVGVGSLDFDRWHYLQGTGPGLSGFISQEKLQSVELWKDPDVQFKMFADVCGKDFAENVTKRIAQTPGEIPSS